MRGVSTTTITMLEKRRNTEGSCRERLVSRTHKLRSNEQQPGPRLRLARANLCEVQAHGDAASPRTEATDAPDDLGDAHAMLVEVVDHLEEVVLGLVHVDLVLVPLVGNLTGEVHLVLLVVRELLVGRPCTAHLVVRVREQLAHARRDGYDEVSDLDNSALLQCKTPIFNFPGVTRAV